MRVYSSKEYRQQEPNLHIFYGKAYPEAKHTHDFVEIVYIDSGKIDHIVNGKEFHAKKGDLLFLNYNSVHSFKPLCPSTYYNISFYPEILEKIITPENAFSLLSLSTFNEISKETNEGLVSFNAHEQRIVKNILDAIAEEQSKHLPRFEVINESYMNILITMILRKTSLPDEPETNAWNELADYISDNLDSDLSLEALAKKCFYNPSYFSRLFKSKFKISLVEYVSNKRVEKAIGLLTDTELSIKAIASACGFSNKSVFYLTFAKITGKTPMEYRGKRDILPPLDNK